LASRPATTHRGARLCCPSGAQCAEERATMIASPLRTSTPHPLTTAVIRTEAQLRELIGEPAPLTCAKISDRLNPMTRLFIERSPFVCLSTSDAAGACDRAATRRGSCGSWTTARC
jgi:hypothetical protein